MSHRNLFHIAIGILLLSIVATAQQIPEQNPSEVWVKGRKVSHSWRDGRIFVATSDLKYLLGTTSDFPQVDLLKALQEKGGYSWSTDSNKFVAKRLRTGGSSSGASRATSFDPKEARRNNAEFLRRQRETKEEQAAEEAARPAPQGHLIYSVQVEQVEWDFYYIHLAVKNDSNVVSHDHRASYYLPRSYQTRAGNHDQIIPPLAPGEIFPFEPIPFEYEKPPGVYVINMNFFNLVNGRNNPVSRWDKRKQARKRKVNRL